MRATPSVCRQAPRPCTISIQRHEPLAVARLGTAAGEAPDDAGERAEAMDEGPHW